AREMIAPYRRAFPGKRERDLAPDASARTGHERHLALDPSRSHEEVTESIRPGSGGRFTRTSEGRPSEVRSSAFGEGVDLFVDVQWRYDLAGAIRLGRELE